MNEMMMRVLTIGFLLLTSILATAQIEILSKNHSKPVLSVVFSPDGKLVACICADKTTKIWNIETGSLVWTLNDEQTGDISVSFSPSGRYLVCGSWDMDVKIWDLTSGNVIKRFSGHDKALRTVDYHPGGEFIASAGWDGGIFIWHTESGVCVKKLSGHSQCVRSICYSPNGLKLASGGYDLQLKTWDVISGKIIDSVKAHTYPVESVTYSPDGEYIITGSVDKTIKIWFAKGLKLYKTLSGHTDGVFCVDVSPDGKYLVSSSNDKTVKIWELKTGKLIKTISSHTMAVKSINFSNDGKKLVTGSTDKSMKVWDISSLNIVNTENIYTEKIKEIKNAISWLVPTSTKYDVLTRNYTIQFKVEEKSLSKFKLILNDNEYAEYDGENTRKVYPTITKDNENATIIEYNIYLKLGINELMLYGESEDGFSYFITDIRSIYCHDYSMLGNNPNLYLYMINMPNYSDKKINAGFSKEDSGPLIEKLKKQYIKLYNNIYVEELNLSTQLTSSALEKSLKEFTIKPRENDIMMIILNAQYAVDSDGYIYLLPSDITDKEEITNAVLFDYIMKYVNCLKSYMLLIVNNGNKLEKSKKFVSPDSEKMATYLSEKMELCYDYSVLIIEPNENESVLDLLTKSFDQENDFDNNHIIEYFDLNEYFKKVSKVQSIHHGNSLPLYIYLDE